KDCPAAKIYISDFHGVRLIVGKGSKMLPFTQHCAKRTTFSSDDSADGYCLEWPNTQSSRLSV
ncbi:MAG: hypothetical protein ACI35M_02210, partial [Alistipes sp.]